MKVFRNLLFLAATAVLLLHVLIPHEHHSPENELAHSHIEPANFFDFIAEIFHVSHVDGQLEEFSRSDFDFVLFSCDFISTDDFSFSSGLDRIGEKIDHQFFYFFKLLHYQIESTSLRGPPIC